MRGGEVERRRRWNGGEEEEIWGVFGRGGEDENRRV